MKQVILNIIRWFVLMGVGLFSILICIDNPLTRLSIALICKFKVDYYVLYYIPAFIRDIILLNLFVFAALILKAYFSSNESDGD